MNILVTLLLAWAHAGVNEPPTCERSFLKRQLAPQRVDELPRHFVTLILHDKSSIRGLLIAAARPSHNSLYFRLLDQETNTIRELAFPAGGPNLSRVLVHPVAPEIDEAKRRAGPEADAVYFEPHQSNSWELLSSLSFKSPVYLVLARKEAFGLELLDGRMTPYSFAERPRELTITTRDGVRPFDSDRLVAAFGIPRGF